MSSYYRIPLPRGLKPDSFLERERWAKTLCRQKTETAACFHKLSEVNPLKPKAGLSGAPGFVIATAFGALVMVLLSTSTAYGASPWTEPSRELARKISEVTGPGAVTLKVTNRSSLSGADVASMQMVLLAELTSDGVHVVPNEPAMATVNVTLSENVREYVWVAEIQQGTKERTVVMVAVPRTELVSLSQVATSVVLRKQLLWSQEDAILDVAMLDSASLGSAHMAVLDGYKVTLYHSDRGQWQRNQELPVLHSQPWPRDLRGRLVPRKDHLLDVYLPGVFCSSTQHPQLALECAPSEEPWPLDWVGSGIRAAFNSKRNYFTGTITPSLGKFSTVPAFYSAVSLPREKYTLWVFTGVDGTVHAVDGMTDQVWHGVAWGSDVASVHTGCGDGWQVTASGRTDAGNDEIRAYDVPDREPIAASTPLSLPGRVTALWNSSEAQALVVIHNEEASRYEAYRVLFTCGD
jgi:hypothetical protein